MEVGAEQLAAARDARARELLGDRRLAAEVRLAALDLRRARPADGDIVGGGE